MVEAWYAGENNMLGLGGAKELLLNKGWLGSFCVDLYAGTIGGRVEYTGVICCIGLTGSFDTFAKEGIIF